MIGSEIVKITLSKKIKGVFKKTKELKKKKKEK